MALEKDFAVDFTAQLALREKQVQQSYRPVIGVHKWFARRPGTLFRSLLLSEYASDDSLPRTFFKSHQFKGIIADPFMGGGTPLIEANRLGFHVVGVDINPMAFWIVRQELSHADFKQLDTDAEAVLGDVSKEVERYYTTKCLLCDSAATVKYFIWTKIQPCPHCGTDNELTPGQLLAEAVRHPKHVLVCPGCSNLVESPKLPTPEHPIACSHCKHSLDGIGSARRSQTTCTKCKETYRYPSQTPTCPPKHKIWAIEYHCAHCKPTHAGRFFKSPDKQDLKLFDSAAAHYSRAEKELPIPNDTVPPGDETSRLLRWGYRSYRDLFSHRQLLGLGLLLRRIQKVSNTQSRHALLTVFSDFLRYQNMLCRYDTYALKCQDIFSVHGFPVGLVQCENNLLGIEKVGSGGFRHFLEKFRKAKEYCVAPFETQQTGKIKKRIPIQGESISAQLTSSMPSGRERQAFLSCGASSDAPLPKASLDGVFTDPPYFDNVQYAELMDFCYVWLRQALRKDVAEFEAASTRAHGELTGNETMGRTIDHFASGLSDTFRRFATALKPGKPFVFTYHHNDIAAYGPIAMALLDAGLVCTTVLPSPAEMEASLHINNTKSSIVDSVFVSRHGIKPPAIIPSKRNVQETLLSNCIGLSRGGVNVSLGDIRCLYAGHVTRLAILKLFPGWKPQSPVIDKLNAINDALSSIAAACGGEETITAVHQATTAAAEASKPPTEVQDERQPALL